MYKFLLCLIPAVLAVNPIPTPCCSPYKFEASLTQVGGYHDPHSNTLGSIDLNGKLHYDFGRKMSRYDSMTTMADGSMTMMSVVTDYSKMLSYTMVNGGCTIERANRTLLNPCIPASATFVGSAFLGSIHDRQHVDIHTWRVEGPGYNIKVTVSDDDCTPMTESIYGTTPAGLSYETTYLFSNFTTGLLKTNYFDLSPQCHHSGSGTFLPPFGKRSIHDHLRPLRSFGL